MANQFIFFVFMILSLSPMTSSAIASSTCAKWFKESKLGRGEECLTRCVVLRVGMDNFFCHDECPQLCDESDSTETLFSLADLYPGLSAEEKALSAKNPTKAIKAYRLTWSAEKLCLTIYKWSETNEESDACRHFIWAALLYKEFGIEFSSQVLNAHEQDPEQPEAEKSMDLANNRLGLGVAEQLIKNKNFGEKSIIDSFKDNLERGRFIVLKKLPSNRRWK